MENLHKKITEQYDKEVKESIAQNNNFINEFISTEKPHTEPIFDVESDSSTTSTTFSPPKGPKLQMTKKPIQITCKDIIIPKTTKMPSYTYFTKTDKLTVLEYENDNLKFIPYLNENEINIYNYERSDLLKEPISKEIIIKRKLINRVLNRINKEELARIMLGKKNNCYREIGELAEYLNVDVKGLIAEYFEFNGFKVEDLFFCMVCLVFGCKLHKEMDFKFKRK